MQLTETEILAKLRTILVEVVGCYADDVTTAATFDDLGADSLDFVEIIMATEEEFGLDIPDDDAAKLLTVQDAITHITNAI